MQVTYTGVQRNLPAKVQEKLDAKFSKLSRLLDGKGEHKAHVIVSQQKRNFRAEVTVHFYDHQFVGLGTDPDLFKAMSAALEKLDAQAVKQRDRWRATHRRSPKPESTASAPQESKKAPAKVAAKSAMAPRLFRVNASRRKPMTAEEAMLIIDKKSNHLVFRDAETDGLSVLVRRPDGNFDLIEA